MSDEPVVIESGATTRRRVFAGAGAMGAAAVLAACGTDQGVDPYTGENVNADADAGSGTPGPASPGATPGGTPSAEPPPAADGLVATGDVEVGGGVLVNDEVVITQPTEGEWRGFSAICTHQGCVVAGVSDGTINCNCHGSRFSIEDGSVVQAAQGLDASQQDPLPPVNVDVVDGQVVRA
jgi:Rieske Fe-S protein